MIIIWSAGDAFLPSYDVCLPVLLLKDYWKPTDTNIKTAGNFMVGFFSFLLVLFFLSQRPHSQFSVIFQLPPPTSLSILSLFSESIPLHQKMISHDDGFIQILLNKAKGITI